MHRMVVMEIMENTIRWILILMDTPRHETHWKPYGDYIARNKKETLYYVIIAGRTEDYKLRRKVITVNFAKYCNYAVTRKRRGKREYNREERTVCC